MAKMPAAMMKKFEGSAADKKADKAGAKKMMGKMAAKPAGKKPGKALPFFMKGKK